MKNIYVFFIATEFKTGKAIRLLTRGKYNHVAFSFSPSISKLYSYSRYRYYEPLISGFGIEYTDRYTYTREDVKIKVCKYEISDEHYNRIKEKIELYSIKEDETQYNFLDLITYPFNVHIDMEYTHTCISFLLDLLEINNIHTIGQLEKKIGDNTVYEGKLWDYEQTITKGPKDFFERRGRVTVYKESGKLLFGLTRTFLGGCIKKITT